MHIFNGISSRLFFSLSFSCSLFQLPVSHGRGSQAVCDFISVALLGMPIPIEIEIEEKEKLPYHLPYFYNLAGFRYLSA